MSRLGDTAKPVLPRLVGATIDRSQRVSLPMTAHETSGMHILKLRNSKALTGRRVHRNSISAKNFTFNDRDFPTNLLNCKQEITIRLLDNWGDPDFLSINDIAMLDIQLAKLKIVDVKTPSTKNIKNLEKLIEQKECLFNDVWTIPFTNKYPLDLIFYVDSTMPIENVRFLNNPIQGKTALRSAEILINDELMWKGEISSDLGVLAHLDKIKYCNSISSRIQVHPDIRRRQLLFKDSGGIVPQSIGTKVTVTFLSNFGNPMTLGICCLSLHDADNKPIPKADVKAHLKNARFDISDDNVIEDNEFFIQDPVKQILFNFDSTNLNKKVRPQIELEILGLHVLGTITVHNCSVPDLPLDINAKGCRIDINNETIWTGKLRQGVGTANEQFYATYTVYISDPNRRISRAERLSHSPDK